MNIVFIGSSKFSHRCLSVCLEFKDLCVTGLVTSPQKFSISYSASRVKNVLHSNLLKFAAERGIGVCSIDRSMNEPKIFNEVTKWKPDAFLVVGWYHMIPKSWRDLAPAYGLHASLLPDYSGGAPLVWAMINGEVKTGITMFKMDDGVDSGPIIGQVEEKIFPEDTISTLYDRIEERGIELLKEILPQLVCGKLKLRPQDELNRRIMPQRSPKDGLIDWTKDSSFIDRFIRAQTKPYPGAFTTFSDKPLHIWKSTVSTKDLLKPPGSITKFNDRNYHVTCGNGSIILEEISYDKSTFSKDQLDDVFGSVDHILGR